MNTSEEGVRGEQAAAEYLIKKGYRVIDRNVSYARRGEIDIVAEKGGAVIFVEVRSRATGDFGDAAETVDRAKRRNLLRAAEAYILERGLNDVEIRFDIIAVRNDMIEHIPNAFYGYWN